MFSKTNFAALLLSATFIGMAAPETATAQTVIPAAAKANNNAPAPAAGTRASKLPKTQEEFEAKIGKKLDPHSALGFYAVIGDYDKARALIRNGLDPNGPLVISDKPDEKPMMAQDAMTFAVTYQSLPAMEFLSEQGMKFKRSNIYAYLVMCTSSRFIEGVEFFINKGLLTDRSDLRDVIAGLKEDLAEGFQPEHREQDMRILKLLETQYNRTTAATQRPAPSVKPS